MAVAAKESFRDNTDKTLRVATKFVNITKKYYAQKSRDIDVVKLNGSIEIAPILGLSDVIVDIVETGTTLKENNLKVFETIVPISARLIANKSSYKFKADKITDICAKLSEQVIKND
jgi:ATP phosphoribosyltransferase